MQGVIQFISPLQHTSRLVDQNGVDRYFDRSELTSKTIKVHDAVEFDLNSTRVDNITLVKKYKKGTVFSWE